MTAAAAFAVAGMAGCSSSSGTSHRPFFDDDGHDRPGGPNPNPPKTAAAMPAFSPSAGTYTSAQKVTITTATADATIRYTLDGTPPGPLSPVYSGPISIGSTATLRAIATKSGYADSVVALGLYTIKVPPGVVESVTISPNSGTYFNDVPVTLASKTLGATICYSIDDSVTPSCLAADLALADAGRCDWRSTEYRADRAPVIVRSGQRIKAIACKQAMVPSSMAEAQYRLEAAPPTFDPPPNANETLTREVTLATTTSGGTIHYTLDGRTPNCLSETPNWGNRIPGIFATDTTVQAVTCKGNYEISKIATAQYKIRASGPTFDPPAYTPVPAGKTLDVTLSSPGATDIAYTTDDSAPSCLNSNKVRDGSKVAVSEGTTLRAVVCRSGREPSWESRAYYPKAGSMAAPYLSPYSGTYNVAQKVEMYSYGADRICYTDDGTDPDCNDSACTAGKPYTAPVTANDKTPVIKAISCKAGLYKSNISTQSYNFKVGDVSFWLSGVGSTIDYWSSTDSEGGVSYHGAFGSDPTCASDLAPTFLRSSDPVDLRVIGCRDGYSPSNIALTRPYTPVTAPPTHSPGSGNYYDVQNVVIDSPTRAKAELATKICYTLDRTEPGCDPQTLACTGKGDVHGGMAPLTVKVNASAVLLSVACAAGGKLPASSWTGSTYGLGMGELAFNPAPTSAPFPTVIPKIDIAIKNAPVNPRICWSDARAVTANECLAGTPSPGAQCVDAATASATRAGGFDTDTTLYTVACKPGEPGLRPSFATPKYAVTPYVHVIEIDGVNDFAEADQFATKNGAAAFASWDRGAYIYMGMRGEAIAPGTNYLSVYLSGAGGVKTGLDTNVISAPTELPFAAKYHVRWRTDGGDTKVRVFDGKNWVDAPFQLTAGEIVRSGTGADSFVELRFPRSAFGSATTVDAAATLWNGATVDAWPAADGSYLHIDFKSAHPSRDSILPRP